MSLMFFDAKKAAPDPVAAQDEYNNTEPQDHANLDTRYSAGKDVENLTNPQYDGSSTEGAKLVTSVEAKSSCCKM